MTVEKNLFLQSGNRNFSKRRVSVSQEDAKNAEKNERLKKETKDLEDIKFN